MANIQFKTKIAVVLVLVCAGMLAGCGSSSSSSTPKPGSGPLTGNWQFLLTNTNVSNPPITKQAGFLSQTGKQVDGTLTFQSSKCSADVNNPICVVDPTCVPDPINPDNCPGPTNTQCTGIRIQGCESGLGTLCKSGAC